jgi:hypothetical protein
MKDGPAWHRVSFAAVKARTDPELPAARRWDWRNVDGQLRLVTPRGRQMRFQLGRPKAGAWVRRVSPNDQAQPRGN